MTIEASHPAFRTALGDLGAAADRLGACRDRVSGEVGALLDGGWAGVAAEAFNSGWEEWRAGAREVLDGLVAMRELVDRVHRDLTARDVAAAGALGELGGRAGHGDGRAAPGQATPGQAPPGGALAGGPLAGQALAERLGR